MSKQTILVTSLNIFAHFGIKSVSMSQVANSVRISKRTLYSYFNSKEELVGACLDYEDENVSVMLRDLERQTKNPVGRLVSLTKKINLYRASYCPAFYKDIVCFHNANLKLNVICRRMRDQLAACFNDGVEEGFFLPERNYEVIASILMEQMILQSRGRISVPHRSTAFFTFLRGLCTEKGLSVLGGMTPSEDEKYAYGYEYDFQ
ncbi:MAG: TetR/AcrR family transcriptional regulator [Tannerella sp.]|jgi:AcrR family transcriptional regulator|nr:TetR/AcrR family transcriptional regulator [Tannerella sp.]